MREGTVSSLICFQFDLRSGRGIPLSQVWIGDPISVLNREYHHPRPGYNPVSRIGVPHPHQQDRGTPLIGRMDYLVAGWGYPLIGRMGYPKWQDWGTPLISRMGYPQ